MRSRMNRTEFIEKLQRALAGGLPSGQVAENVRYYQDYIDSEMRRGRTECQVMEQLGDPRLLAKSIIEANKRAGTSYGSNQEFDEEVTDETWGRNGEGGTGESRRIVLPGWLVMLIVTVVVLLIIGLLTSLIAIFAPVILAVLIVLLVIKLIQGNWRRR